MPLPRSFASKFAPTGAVGSEVHAASALLALLRFVVGFNSEKWPFVQVRR